MHQCNAFEGDEQCTLPLGHGPWHVVAWNGVQRNRWRDGMRNTYRMSESGELVPTWTTGDAPPRRELLDAMTEAAAHGEQLHFEALREQYRREVDGEPEPDPRDPS
jgi:hypothetical protein